MFLQVENPERNEKITVPVDTVSVCYRGSKSFQKIAEPPTGDGFYGHVNLTGDHKTDIGMYAVSGEYIYPIPIGYMVYLMSDTGNTIDKYCSDNVARPLNN